tara:strand:- start:2023 stop:2178 length:156 start_codon:yes stop_codon:yes gene_type:complete
MTNLSKLYEIQKLIDNSYQNLQVNDVRVGDLLKLNEYIQTLIEIESEYLEE